MEYLNSKQMARVDKKAIEKGLSPLQLMENVGSNVANFISNLKPRPEKVIIIFGKGNNGADGLATARHLVVKGIKVELIPASEEINENTKKQLAFLKNIGINPKKDLRVNGGELIIDSLLGYSIKGDPRGRYKELIESINYIHKKGNSVLSLDLPSGLDPNTGKEGNPTINPDYTLTFGLPKKGLKGMKNVFLVNLGIPSQVYKESGLEHGNYFMEKDVIKLTNTKIKN